MKIRHIAPVCFTYKKKTRKKKENLSGRTLEEKKKSSTINKTICWPFFFFSHTSKTKAKLKGLKLVTFPMTRYFQALLSSSCLPKTDRLLFEKFLNIHWFSYRHQNDNPLVFAMASLSQLDRCFEMHGTQWIIRDSERFAYYHCGLQFTAVLLWPYWWLLNSWNVSCKSKRFGWNGMGLGNHLYFLCYLFL